MATRQVTGVVRDERGRTITLSNAAEPWSPVSAEHAARQIEAHLHVYVASSGAGQARIGVVNGRNGPYLRTRADAEQPDNLDSLPVSVGHPLTGAFDVVIEVSEATLQTALTAMHASGAIAHRASASSGDDFAVLALGAPRIALIETTSAMATCQVRTPFVAWVRRRDSATDAGYTASGEVNVPAACFAVTEADGSFTLATNWRAVQTTDVTVTGPAPAAAKARVRAAVVAWAREAGGRYPVPSVDALGHTSGIGLRFARKDAGVGVQLGLDIVTATDLVAWPLATGSSMRVALSARWVTLRVMEGLRAYLGGLPPPYGDDPVDLGGGISLVALDVDLGDHSLTFTGQLASGLISASFTASIAVSGTTPGGVKAGASGTVAGAGTDADGVTVDVTGILGTVANFFSGGALKRALTDGIRTALAQDRGGLADLLSRSTVRATASAGSAAAIKLDTRITSTDVTAFGVVLEGVLSAGAQPPVYAQLDAIGLGGTWRLLSVMSSWAPGDQIDAVSLDFGDGEQVDLTGTSLALAVPHEYAVGTYTARATITDRGGRKASASTRVRVA